MKFDLLDELSVCCDAPHMLLRHIRKRDHMCIVCSECMQKYDEVYPKPELILTIITVEQVTTIL
jgi:hypothetical protein